MFVDFLVLIKLCHITVLFLLYFIELLSEIATI